MLKLRMVAAVLRLRECTVLWSRFDIHFWSFAGVQRSEWILIGTIDNADRLILVWLTNAIEEIIDQRRFQSVADAGRFSFVEN